MLAPARLSCMAVICDVSFPVELLLRERGPALEQILNNIVKRCQAILPESQGDEVGVFCSRVECTGQLVAVENWYKCNAVLLSLSRPCPKSQCPGQFSLRLWKDKTTVGFWRSAHRPMHATMGSDEEWEQHKQNGLYHYVEIEFRNSRQYTPGFKVGLGEDAEQQFLTAFGRKFTLVTPQQAEAFNCLPAREQDRTPHAKDVAAMYRQVVPPLGSMAFTVLRKHGVAANGTRINFKNEGREIKK